MGKDFVHAGSTTALSPTYICGHTDTDMYVRDTYGRQVQHSRQYQGVTSLLLYSIFCAFQGVSTGVEAINFIQIYPGALTNPIEPEAVPPSSQCWRLSKQRHLSDW